VIILGLSAAEIPPHPFTVLNMNQQIRNTASIQDHMMQLRQCLC